MRVRIRRRRVAATAGRGVMAPVDVRYQPHEEMRPGCSNATRAGRWQWACGLGLVVSTALAAACLWSVGLVRFADNIPKQVADSVTATDAIVVLTGGSERVATGLQLLAADKAQRALISGVHPGVAVSDLLRLVGASQQPIETRVDAGYGARDTAGNAVETADWMHARGYRSLRLVTGNYHMPRSLFEFNCALPDARVVPHPVFPQVVHNGAWWSRPGTAALIISEYNKYLLASLRHRVTGSLARCG
jgi:uncharacterized SAM-binding protein YcdF (DUF218 family)